MELNKKWVALFSHSGTEIADIIKTFKSPDWIFTNQRDVNKINKELHDKHVVKCVHSVIMQAIKEISTNLPEEKIIVTLHGYMRIIPKEIIDLPNVEIYNVHPGDITTYPELRGADPQKKALELNLPTTGVVIHKVDEGVDTGAILMQSNIMIHIGDTEESLTNRLRDESIVLWKLFLLEVLN